LHKKKTFCVLTPFFLKRVSRCIKVLETFLAELRGRTVDPSSSCFKIKIQFVANASRSIELEVFPHSTVGEVAVEIAKQIDSGDARSLRLIAAGQELKYDGDTVADYKLAPNAVIHCVIRNESKRNAAAPATPYVPPSLVSTDPELAVGAILNLPVYFDRIFSLLDLPQQTSEIAFVLLSKLPPNPALLARLEKLEGDVIDWSSLLPTSSICKFYYSMRLVEVVSAKDAWLRQFHARGGLQYLGKVFVNRDWLPPASGGYGTPCLTLLLKVAVRFCVDSKTGVLNECVDDFVPRIKLLDRVLSLLEGLAQFRQQHPGMAAHLLCELLVALVGSSAEAMQHLFGSQGFLSWLRNVVLLSAVPAVRASVSDSLLEIAQRDAQVSARLLEGLLVLLVAAEENNETCVNYFSLVDKLVGKVVASNPPAFEGLARGLSVRILARPTLESHSPSEKEGPSDYVLQGYMQLLNTLLQHNLPLAVALANSEGKLLAHLFKDCLFNGPTLESHGPLSAPKCKNRSTRSSALNLLLVFARASPELYKVLTNALIEHHAMGETRSNWQYLPSAMEKDVCGYVGLKNLGAT
jgi:hypothetical protein